MFVFIFLGFTVFFSFCIPSCISWVHHSSSALTAISSFSSAFPAMSLGFTILLFFLLMRSQLYLWGSPFFFFCIPSNISGVHHSFFFCIPSYTSGVHRSSSAFPAVSQGFTILLILRFQLHLWGQPFWVRLLLMWWFFNPTIEVVTFGLCEWCVLGVFLLPAFTLLGHECQDLLSPCNGMHVCTD